MTEPLREPLNELPADIELAQAFTAALNAHDVDAVIELFTEEDSGPTITADAYAWQKFEIGLWAQQQVQASIRIDAYDYRLMHQGATWNADVYRDDWRQHGVDPLRVTNTISVRRGRLANFTSTPRNQYDAESLGRLWRPGVSPEHPPK